MVKRQPLSIKASPDLCGGLGWSMAVVGKYLKTRRPSNSEEARDCRGGVVPMLDLMDQVGCAMAPNFRRDMLSLCKVK